MKTTVTIYLQDMKAIKLNPNLCPFTANPNLARYKAFEYKTEKEGQEAAEEAFTLTNAPHLTKAQEEKIKGYQGHSISIGDEVVTKTKDTERRFVCSKEGWIEKYIENTKEQSQKETPTIQIHGETCNISPNLYKNGQIALELTCQDGSPYSTPSVNLPEETPKKNEVYIKNYSENQGVAGALILNGIATDKGAFHLPPYGAEVVILEITNNILLEQIDALRKRREASQKTKTIETLPTL